MIRESLAHRPVHMSLDVTGSYALVAYNIPAGVTVHRIGADGTIVSPVSQPGTLDSGIFAHQVRVAPARSSTQRSRGKVKGVRKSRQKTKRSIKSELPFLPEKGCH